MSRAGQQGSRRGQSPCAERRYPVRHVGGSFDSERLGPGEQRRCVTVISHPEEHDVGNRIEFCGQEQVMGFSRDARIVECRIGSEKTRRHVIEQLSSSHQGIRIRIFGRDPTLVGEPAGHLIPSEIPRSEFAVGGPRCRAPSETERLRSAIEQSAEDICSNDGKFFGGIGNLDAHVDKTSAMDITYDGGTVTGTTSGTPGSVGVLLAHGAGVGQDHPWMVTVREGLVDAGLFVMSFNYRYTEAGRKAPDRMPMLLAVHRAAADALAGECDRVVLAGKSMGGRVGSHLVGDGGWPAAGLVYFGYPLVPMGKGEPRPVGHLEAIEAPQLFFAGTRDRLSPPTLIAEIVRSVPDGTLEIVDDGDHSFKVPKRAGKSNEEVLAGIVTRTADWISRSVLLY